MIVFCALTQNGLAVANCQLAESSHELGHSLLLEERSQVSRINTKVTGSWAALQVFQHSTKSAMAKKPKGLQHILLQSMVATILIQF